MNGDERSSCPSPEEQEPPTLREPQEHYHIFTRRQKWNLIFVIGAAGLFSGLSSNIYFPAEDQIAQVGQSQQRREVDILLTELQDLKISLSLVSLTITSYLVIQGISPVFWGALADTIGRRPIYIASFSVYILSNIALSYSPNFAVLLLFRGLQSAGSASTVSIGESNGFNPLVNLVLMISQGNGVIQDITPLAERGGFISFYQASKSIQVP